MARRHSLAAGVLSLILVATWGNAQAESEATSDSGPTYITLFGKTFCTAEAPAVVDCDYRLPLAAGDEGEARRDAFMLFGDRYCLGPEVEGQCDVRIPSKPPARRFFDLLGLRLCFGGASPDLGCHVTLPESTGSDARRASL